MGHRVVAAVFIIIVVVVVIVVAVVVVSKIKKLKENYDAGCFMVCFVCVFNAEKGSL